MKQLGIRLERFPHAVWQARKISSLETPACVQIARNVEALIGE